MVKVFNKTISNIFSNILMTKILHGLKTKSINFYTNKMNLITSLNQIFKKKLFKAKMLKQLNNAIVTAKRQYY